MPKPKKLIDTRRKIIKELRDEGFQLIRDGRERLMAASRIEHEMLLERRRGNDGKSETKTKGT